ncbi:MAG: response regulator [Candidatus Jorgensenbacteria bacterium]
MKILLVEDNEFHIEAAQDQLREHELTIIRSFNELYPWRRGWDGPERQGFTLSQYDAVLTDINLPSPVDTSSGLGNMEGPTGLLVMLKALESGVKYIGAITDVSHHSKDPIAKGLDMWIHAGKPIEAGNSRIFLECYNACCYDSGDPNYEKWGGGKSRKNWGRLLRLLTGRTLPCDEGYLKYYAKKEKSEPSSAQS